MATVERFQELHAWQAARMLVRDAYKISRETPLAKDFPSRDQIRRAAISIMAHIAEGFERRGEKEFAYFLAVAKGSCGELRSLLVIAGDQAYLDSPRMVKLDEACHQISRMLAALMRYLDRTHRAGRRLGTSIIDANTQDHR